MRQECNKQGDWDDLVLSENQSSNPWAATQHDALRLLETTIAFGRHDGLQSIRLRVDEWRQIIAAAQKADADDGQVDEQAVIDGRDAIAELERELAAAARQYFHVDRPLAVAELVRDLACAGVNKNPVDQQGNPLLDKNGKPVRRRRPPLDRGDRLRQQAAAMHGLQVAQEAMADVDKPKSKGVAKLIGANDAADYMAKAHGIRLTSSYLERRIKELERRLERNGFSADVRRHKRK